MLPENHREQFLENLARVADACRAAAATKRPGARLTGDQPRLDVTEYAATLARV